jgi:hypothetical protein
MESVQVQGTGARHLVSKRKDHLADEGGNAKRLREDTGRADPLSHQVPQVLEGKALPRRE